MSVTKRVRAWELIEEDDGTQTMCIEYFDGTRDELRGVVITEMTTAPSVGEVVTQVPLTFAIVKV